MSRLRPKAGQEGRGEDTESSGYSGGIFMRWPWRLRGAIEPRLIVSRVMELETAKEILAEIFSVFHPRFVEIYLIEAL